MEFDSISDLVMYINFCIELSALYFGLYLLQR